MRANKGHWPNLKLRAISSFPPAPYQSSDPPRKTYSGHRCVLFSRKVIKDFLFSQIKTVLRDIYCFVWHSRRHVLREEENVRACAWHRKPTCNRESDRCGCNYDRLQLWPEKKNLQGGTQWIDNPIHTAVRGMVSRFICEICTPYCIFIGFRSAFLTYNRKLWQVQALLVTDFFIWLHSPY